jgi:ATP-dependent exoDNAse (exonuclease V) beta subunit
VNVDIAEMQAVRVRLERYFLTQAGKPRQKLSKPFGSQHFANADARRRHESALSMAAPRIKEALEAFDADLDVLLARGLQRMLELTVRQFTRLLEEHALLDFAGMLDRAVTLLERQEEFARSRLKLQSRYHHLLVDEFQDTSRRQWRLIELLIDAWAEGDGLADAPTSVFIVGDRKQSIYRFRHAEVTLLDEAAERIGMLRPGARVRHAITTSFRAVPELLAFVNAMAASLSGDPELDDRWRYDPTDRFPVAAVSPGARRDGRPVLGLVAEPTLALSAAAVAAEIERLLQTATVRERTGGPRPIRPDDIAILFRTRAGHQVFEEALERRGIQTYVYKGLGFFDAPEVQDLQALIRFLAQPDSDLRAAELLRSRLIRLSDVGLERLAPRFAAALTDAEAAPAVSSLSEADGRLLAHARASVSTWLTLADRLPPSEVIDLVLRESAYAAELRGRRLGQARENVKKLRALVRRVENRGYTTFGRLAAYFETLRSGDDSNAIIEAVGSVNLMTMHAAKGLEFPVVFLVNLHMGGRARTGGVSVIERGHTGEAEVTFGTSDATRLEDARETEELRRLLYVAITRARDRLYLAGEVDAEGRLRRGQRSLAALLPASLTATFAAASGPTTTEQETVPRRAEVEWAAEEGTFAFSVCIPPAVTPVPVEAVGLASPAVTMPAELVVDGRMAATAAIIGNRRTNLESEEPSLLVLSGSEPLLGTLVHRCFARGVDPATADPAAIVERCLAPDERIDVSDALALGMRALALYAGLRDDPELRTLLGSGQVLYEVPFCYGPPGDPGPTLRGVIDCLILRDNGAVVVEFKTGAPRPEHQTQTQLYRLAVSAIVGDMPVEVRVFYPNL